MTERILRSIHSFNWRSTALGITSYMLALVFLGSGGAKVIGMETQVEQFTRLGYPLGFMIAVGAAELLLAVLVAHPDTRFGASMGLLLIMAAAVGTHLSVGEFGMALVPLGYSIVCAGIAWVTCPVGWFELPVRGLADQE
jgi:putative oxidoreductase